MTSAARRASRESSMVQQPRAPVREPLRVRREREVHSRHVVSRLGGPGGGDGGVDASGHGGQDTEGALGRLRGLGQSHSSNKVRGAGIRMPLSKR
ncbi:hypothetical protein SALBM135S_07065 [Streptomyces alboniger]